MSLCAVGKTVRLEIAIIEEVKNEKTITQPQRRSQFLPRAQFSVFIAMEMKRQHKPRNEIYTGDRVHTGWRLSLTPRFSHKELAV